MSPTAHAQPTPLIIADLVRLDVSAGHEKTDVIDYLADVVAAAGRADAADR